MLNVLTTLCGFVLLAPLVCCCIVFGRYRPLQSGARDGYLPVVDVLSPQSISRGMALQDGTDVHSVDSAEEMPLVIDPTGATPRPQPVAM